MNIDKVYTRMHQWGGLIEEALIMYHLTGNPYYYMQSVAKYSYYHNLYYTRCIEMILD